jgi:hypothetical protein
MKNKPTIEALGTKYVVKFTAHGSEHRFVYDSITEAVSELFSIIDDYYS